MRTDGLRGGGAPIGFGGRNVATRLASGRREDLLDGVMAIIAAHGFSEVRISEIAHGLHCSVASLYKIAPSRDSLVLIAMARWEELTFENIEDASRRGKTTSEQARIYFRSGARSISALSHEFRVDADRFESTRAAWHRISDRFHRRIRRTGQMRGGSRRDSRHQ